MTCRAAGRYRTISGSRAPPRRARTCGRREMYGTPSALRERSKLVVGKARSCGGRVDPMESEAGRLAGALATCPTADRALGARGDPPSAVRPRAGGGGAERGRQRRCGARLVGAQCGARRPCSRPRGWSGAGMRVDGVQRAWRRSRRRAGGVVMCVFAQGRARPASEWGRGHVVRGGVGRAPRGQRPRVR